MGRARKHPSRAFVCTETFAGNDPDTGEPYGAHKGDIWLDGPLLRKCLMFFEPMQDGMPVPAELIERVSAEPVSVKSEKEVK